MDVLHSLAVLQRAEVVCEALKNAKPLSSSLTRLRDDVVDTIEGLGVEHRVAAFGTPAAGWDARGETWPLETLRPTPRADAALTLWRHLVGVPLGLDLTVVVAEPGSRTHFVDLPHHGVRVLLTGPLLLTIRPDGGTIMAWDDGVSVTLASGRPGGSLIDTGLLDGRVRGLPWAMRRPVEPANPALAESFADFEPAEPDLAGAVLEAHRKGLWLLEEVWQEEFDMAARWIKGWLPLHATHGIRSHSSPSLPGVVLSSADEPWAAVDAIVHESAHLRIGAVLHHDPLLENAMALGYPSPWRVDPRPLLGLLIGVHAFVDICTWHRRVLDRGGFGDDVAARSEAIHERQRANCQTAWKTLSAVGRPTVLGSVVLDGLASEVAAL